MVQIFFKSDFSSDIFIWMIIERAGFKNYILIGIRIYAKTLVIWVVMIDVIAQ